MRPFGYSLCYLFALVAGCSDSAPNSAGETTLDCGSGDAVTTASHRACVFEAPLIIEGFMCPDAVPHAYDLPGGGKACMGQAGLPSAAVDEVMEAWEQAQAGDGTDASDGTDATDGTDGAEGFDGFPIDAPADPTAAYVPCDREVGQEMIVIDWPCPVAEVCSDGGALAQCDEDFGGKWYCRCNARDQVMCHAVDKSVQGCPALGAPAGSPCDIQVGEDSCAEGHYCRLNDDAPSSATWPFEPTLGTCTALPVCSGGLACWRDSDCGAGATCRDADRTRAIVGACREPVTAPTCLVDSDCPLDWTCDGATLGCADPCECADPTAPDSPGQCVKVNGFSDLTLWTPETVLWEGQTIQPYFAKGDIGENSDWITCPSYDVERLDLELGWVPMGQESCPDGTEATLTEVPPGGFQAVNPFVAEVPEGSDWLVLRLVGHYYTGCEGAQSPFTCSGGPYDRFWSDVVVVALP